MCCQKRWAIVVLGALCTNVFKGDVKRHNSTTAQSCHHAMAYQRMVIRKAISKYEFNKHGRANTYHDGIDLVPLHHVVIYGLRQGVRRRSPARSCERQGGVSIRPVRCTSITTKRNLCCAKQRNKVSRRKLSVQLQCK